MATRRERVVLELTDNLSGGLARAAAQAALLRRELDGLNGGTRDASRGNDDLTRSSSRLTNQLGNQDRTMQNSTRQIDRYSGRLKLIGQALAILGPAAIPIGAVAIPAITGLATSLGFATLAAGTSVLAFQGVGDALKAMSKAHLEPTTENLRAAQIAMENLSPAAQDLVTKLRSLSDEGRALRDSAAEGLFPGVIEALDALESRLPQLERILHEVGDTAGDIAASGAESLASSRWDDFFNFLETDARHTLEQLAEAAGNTGHALATMLVAMDPLNDDFMGWLVDATEDLDNFAMGLEDSQGFQEFINYIRTNGPQVAATFAAIGQAVLDIVEAAAPLGGIVLQGLESIAKVVSAIADSNLGTPIMAGLAAMSLMTRATALWGATSVASARASVGSTLSAAAGYNMVAVNAQRATLSVGEFAAAQRTAAAATSVARAKMGMMAAGIGLMAASQTDFVKSQGLSNTAMFTGLGLMAGPWGAAIGAGVGMTMDLAHSQDALTTAVAAADAAIESQSLTAMAAARDRIAAQLAEQDAKATGSTPLNFMGADIGLAFGQAANLIGELGGASDAARGKVDELNTAMANLPTEPALLGGGNAFAAQDLEAATRAAEEYAAALTVVYGLLDQRSAVRAAEASLDNFTAGLKENGRTMDDNTAKGRANLDNLDEIARTHNKVAEGMKESNRIPYLRQARADFVDAATKLGMTKRAARDLATDLGLLNTLKVSPKVDVDTKGAEAGVRRLGGVFNSLPDKVQTNIKANGIPKTMGDVNRLVARYGLTEKERRALITLKDAATPNIKAILKLLDTTDRKNAKPTVTGVDHASPMLSSILGRIAAIQSKTVTITTEHVDHYTGPGNPLIDHAAGGLILGPGTGTSDSIPARLSNREYVVKAAAVERYGVGFMDQVNAMRFSSGGHVARAATIASASPTQTLVGLRIEGRMSIDDNGGTYFRGMVREEIDADRRFDKARRGA